MIQWFCDFMISHSENNLIKCEKKKFLQTAEAFIYHIFSCLFAVDALLTMCVCLLTCPRAVCYQSAEVVWSVLSMFLSPLPSHCCWTCSNARMGILSDGERSETPGTADMSGCSTWVEPNLWWKLCPKACYDHVVLYLFLEYLLLFISAYFLL